MPQVSRSGSIGVSDRKHDDHDEDDDDNDPGDNHGDDYDDDDSDYDDDDNRSRGRRTSRGRVGHAGHTRLAYKVLSPTNTKCSRQQIQSALDNKYKVLLPYLIFVASIGSSASVK